MLCLVQLPDLTRRARKIMTNPNSVEISTFDLLDIRSAFMDLQLLYDSVQQRFRDQYDAAMKTSAEVMKKRSVEMNRLIHCHHVRTLSIGLIIGILIDSLRLYLKIDTDPIPTLLTRNQRSSEILALSTTLTQYRPLGSMATILGLSAAWFGTSDAEVRKAVEELAIGFDDDLHGVGSRYSSLGYFGKFFAGIGQGVVRDGGGVWGWRDLRFRIGA